MKSLKPFLAAILVLIPLAATPVLAAGVRYTLDPDHTQVRIHWNHFGFSNPGADFNISKGTLVWDAAHPERSSVSVTIPIASVHTQVPALDKRFKTMFFDAAKYPTITFKSTGVKRVGKSNHYRVAGELTVRGISKPVTLDVTLNKAGVQPMLDVPAIGFDATGSVKRSEFGMGAFVPAVSDLVHIHITTEGVAAKPKPAAGS